MDSLPEGAKVCEACGGEPEGAGGFDRNGSHNAGHLVEYDCPACNGYGHVCAVCGGSVEEPKTKRHGIGDGWVTFECDSKYHDRRG